MADNKIARVIDYRTILRPVISEKSSMASGGEVVVFEVLKTATKLEIKEAVERVYSVKVDAVRTINVMGKVKRSATSVGRRPNRKKAYITLKEGSSINVVEGL
jgi:large subunit ribosomal protein L23